MTSLFKRSLAAAAMAAAVVFGGSTAHAAVITMMNDEATDQGSENSAGIRGYVTCDVACSVLKLVAGTYSFGTDFGEFFGGPGSSGDQFEAGWVNTVLGLSGANAFTTANVTAGKNTGVNSTTYNSNSLYVVLKIGNEPDYTIIRNDSYTALNWSYTQAGKPSAYCTANNIANNNCKGSQGGLSHYVNLGAVPNDPGVGITPVPLPAGLPLLAGALGLAGLIARRRKAA